MGSMSCNLVARYTGCDPFTMATLAGFRSRCAPSATAPRRAAGQSTTSGIVPMQNQEKFEARHTDAGNALLFSIDAGGVLSLTREVKGSAPAWQREDLSSAQIRRDLPRGRCTDFASALSVPVPGRPGAIHLAMVVNDGRSDHLYLSLSNSASDLAWSAAPVWTACPFNAGAAPARLAIAGIQIGEANDGLFIAVDLVGQPDDGGGAPLRKRYYLDAGHPDAGQTGTPRWMLHNAPIDAGAAIYASCLGRSQGGWKVDGLYLAGRIGDTAQLIYAPLYHPFSPSMPATPRRLALPDDRAAGTIAACRNADNTASLFATSGGALYFFSATNQLDGAQALQLLADPLFEGMRTLFAFAADGRFTVLGLNGAGQVVTTGADQVVAAEPAHWSPPRVILSGAAAIAPCLDGERSPNTLFVQTAKRMVKVSRPSAGAAWTGHDIFVPA